MNKENKILIRTIDVDSKVLYEEWVRCDEENSFLIMKVPYKDGHFIIDYNDVANLVKNIQKDICDGKKVINSFLKIKKLKANPETQMIIQEIPSGLRGILPFDVIEEFTSLFEKAFEGTNKKGLRVIATPLNVKVMSRS